MRWRTASAAVLVAAIAAGAGIVGEAAGLTVAMRFGAAVSNRVTVANSTSIENLMPVSVLVAYRPSVITANNSLLMKGSAAGASRKFVRINTGGNLSMVLDRPGTDTTFTTSNAPLVAGQIVYILITADTSVSPVVHIYTGTQNAPMSEATYSATTDGTGGLVASDSGTSLQLCNVFAIDNACKGDVWAMQYVSGVLPLVEGRQWQQRAASNPPVRGARGVWTMGRNGAGVVFDRSGYGNHGTITGAVSVSETLPGITWRRAA